MIFSLNLFEGFFLLVRSHVCDHWFLTFKNISVLFLPIYQYIVMETVARCTRSIPILNSVVKYSLAQATVFLLLCDYGLDYGVN